jgi:glycosyltransferase involved in cell wall biosynthesis
MPGMKITFYNGTDCFSGLEKNTLRFVEWLEENGNEVVFVSAAGTPMTHALEEKKYELFTLEKQTKYFSLIKSFRLAKLLKTEKIKSLIITRPRDILMSSLTKFFFYRKLILIFFQQSNLKLKSHPLLYKMLFYPFNAWIAPSENIRKNMLNSTGYRCDQCQVVAPCIDIDYYENDTLTRQAARNLLDLPEKGTIVGVFGRHDLRRRQDFVIRSIQFLRKNRYTVDLLIMGQSVDTEEENYFRFLKELARECNVEDYVHFRPYTEKMIIFFRAIDIFTLNVTPEPYDLSLIKAMATGLPVVASFSPQHEEILGNGNFGLLFKEDNLEDFTAKIIHLLTQPKLVNYIIEEARKHVHEKYDKLKNCRQLEDLMKQLLDKN